VPWSADFGDDDEVRRQHTSGHRFPLPFFWCSSSTSHRQTHLSLGSMLVSTLNRGSWFWGWGRDRRLKKLAIQTKKCGMGRRGQVAARGNLIVMVLVVLDQVVVVPEDDLPGQDRGVKEMKWWLMTTTCREVWGEAATR
jgi:hypothetical protein